ncbi:MAG TPA: methionine--tRNA ligase subunit beta [Phycisphaerales bacterium]|nr:methionine--tRNA ligase subunit beta [Phycisphaerales bacterium]
MSETSPAASTPTPASAPAPAAPAQPEARPQIMIDDFAKVELKVAKVVKAEFHPSADKLLKLQLDDGSGTPRQICAGIRANYTPESLVGRSIIIVANLAPRNLRGEESRGMLLAASSTGADGVRQVVILSPAGDVPPGSLVG